MTDNIFYRQFLALFAIVLVVLIATSFIPVFSPYTLLSYSGFIFFNLLSLAAYYLGKKSLNSSNKFLFNNLVILNVMTKMLVSVAIIVIYQRTTHPETNWFVLPFLVLYLIYTIFETYILTKLVKAYS